MTHKFKYEVVKADKTDFKQSLLRKSNVTVDFKIADVEAHEQSLRKTLAEWDGRARINRATMTNIRRNHPFVIAMSKKDRFTVHMYQEAENVVRTIEPKLKEIKEALEEYAAEKADLYKQLGFKDAPEGEAK